MLDPIKKNFDENDVTNIYCLLQKYDMEKDREDFNYWDFIVEYLQGKKVE